ncbi:YwqG family protein [Isobaculum melis]|uniref:Uncharacterized protein YwqG n=1 Tax=Isobaculum melis TaxID=142588 RepID=A0A1H9RKT3_9LACT|nr:YwqG family protein [Isobaculum melis]SER72653.1 Uncharacterized protein YwqG [Isobaculum melis]
MIERLQEFLPAACIEKIKLTKKPRISLTFEATETLTLTQSKIGGRGYLSKKMPYPVDQNQKPLSLLAQINFAEMPVLADFPTKGLLSFYVNYHDDLLGLNFDDPIKQQGFRVIYTESFSDESYTEAEQNAFFEQTIDENDYYPVVPKEASIIGKETAQLLVADSVDFEQAYGGNSYELLENIVTDESKMDDFYDLSYDAMNEAGYFSSQLGGYPFFTQEDPRYTKERQYYDTLLFQLASDQIDEQSEIMWGDCGVGNFFIHHQDLINQDFTKVMYNWDCS